MAGVAIATLLITSFLPGRPTSYSLGQVSYSLGQAGRARRAAVSLDSSPESCDAEAGWCTSASGLKYIDEDAAAGGEAPAAPQVVKVAYAGTVLSDGRKVEFPGAKSPLRWVLGSGPPLWEEAVAGMRVGGRRRLLVPPSASFRAQATSGSAGAIEADETIRFEFELQAIESGPAAKLAELRAWYKGLEGARPSWQGALLLLSAAPYLLPSELRPGPWQGSFPWEEALGFGDGGVADLGLGGGGAAVPPDIFDSF